MREKLGEILIRKGLINTQQLNEALTRQKEKRKKIGETLISLGMVTEENVFRSLGEQWGVEFISADSLAVKNPGAMSVVPEGFAKEHFLIPLDFRDNMIVVAMADPDDIVALDNLEKLSGKRVDAKLASPTAILGAIENSYEKIRKQGEVTEAIGDLQFFATSDEDDESMVDMSKTGGTEDAPVVKLVNLMLQDAIKSRATDIHIEPYEEALVVRFRIDGVLQEVMRPPKASHAGIVSRVKILSKLNIAEKRLPQDGRFTVRTTEKEIDMRVSILPLVTGEKIVMRLLDKSSFAFSLATLGFDDDESMIFRRWIRQPYGMVIISGPTGAGKSTTLFAALNEIKSVEDNITTVEDPVEYHVPGVNQVQTKAKIGLTFAAALRSILRQDPDKLLIGEIRDEETADIAVKFALTGHLVFSTVHANDAPSTITRLLDIGVPPFLCGSVLNLVMAQRLVRRICQHCKTEYEPDDAELESLMIDRAFLKGRKFYQGRGCAQCRNTGYLGRTGIFEVLEMRRNIRSLVFDNANQDEIRNAALANGMVTLRDAAFKKIFNGITTSHELLRVTVTEI
ncbi:MAG: Flp pilus assembly complex ATPase component TadA [Calditrichaeota bacterium]|nr:Flp pilus assembly complex ATPase component TadA [Calditrichota bacterium]